jgi:hypothetical protein
MIRLHFLFGLKSSLGSVYPSAQNAFVVTNVVTSVVEINKRGECYAFFWLHCSQKTAFCNCVVSSAKYVRYNGRILCGRVDAALVYQKSPRRYYSPSRFSNQHPTRLCAACRVEKSPINTDRCPFDLTSPVQFRKRH